MKAIAPVMNSNTTLNKNYIDFVITQSSIENGRIYFSSTNADFFPPNAIGGRGTDEHADATVAIEADGTTYQTDIRQSSALRISPRKSFKVWLKKVEALDGDSARLHRISQTQYRIEYLSRSGRS